MNKWLKLQNLEPTWEYNTNKWLRCESSFHQKLTCYQIKKWLSYGAVFQGNLFSKNFQMANMMSFLKTFEWNHNLLGSPKQYLKIDFIHTSTQSEKSFLELELQFLETELPEKRYVALTKYTRPTVIRGSGVRNVTRGVNIIEFTTIVVWM